ncbi:hypothetical protein HF265_18000 [Rhizobium leguminosarum]|uniref:hypothetical protein n=1 Tax=Rhizobium leguminosarum TaxID=384 RepID=UPI001C917BFD|nr:hypothetical protein [Rhizobium leguminosarum]MBY3030971.1 hypothetical protein [Rhizobium leguminosarum]
MIRNSLGDDLTELINALKDARVMGLARALSEPISAYAAARAGSSMSNVVAIEQEGVPLIAAGQPVTIRHPS